MTQQLTLEATPASERPASTKKKRAQKAAAVDRVGPAQKAALPAKVETAAVPAPTHREPASQATALMLMIERAVTNPDFDVEKMRELFKLRAELEAQEARKAFIEALSAFKADPPTILKNKKASFDHKKDDGKTEYEFATLAQVVNCIAPALAKYGLSHTWETAQDTGTGGGGLITVTCHLRHALGHAETTMLKASPDSSGSKNNIQAVGSTITYLQRYTLLAATGLAAKDQDTDANFKDFNLISAEEKAELVTLMKEVKADTGRFLKFLKVQTLDELPATKFNEAKQALLDKKRAAGQ